MLGSFVLLALTCQLFAQPISGYTNNGTINAPPDPVPQIDATRFENNGLFNIGLSSSLGTSIGGVVFITSTLFPYDFSDTLFYTNRNIMSCDNGFTFDFAPAVSGVRGMSASFGNGNTGQVLAGSANSPFFGTNLLIFTGFGVSSFPALQVAATNVINTGLLDVGLGGLLSVQGMDLNLRRGTLHVEGFEETNLLTTFGTSIGIFNNYQGIGKQTNQLSVGTLSLPFPQSPINNVTNTAAVPTISLVSPPFASAFVFETPINASNTSIQVVYINTNLPGISTDVRFEGGGGLPATPIIKWEAVITNNLGLLGKTVTVNDLYLSDIFGSFATNFVFTNSFTFTGVPQIVPYNYSFSRSDPTLVGYTNLPGANAPFDARVLFGNAFPATNAYSAYGVTLAPVTAIPDPTLPGSTFTNVPGRLLINAGTSLDLTQTKVTGANFLSLVSTNHFAGSANAQNDSPYMDMFLGTTNGMMSISNTVPPFVPRFTGPIDMWSGRWTNVDANGFTNTYHILIVNAQFTPTSPVQVLNCGLRSTNVTISDTLNINNTFLINGNALTITSNTPDAATPYGQVNVLSGDIIWSASLPTLQNLTNFGLISLLNIGDFVGKRNPPYFANSFTEPYMSFINHGLISDSGTSILANYVENSGVGLIITNDLFISTTSNNSALIYSSVGPITVNANTAQLVNAGFSAPAGDIAIGAGTLMVSNHFLTASGALTLLVTNSMTDGGTTSNFWSVGDGMNLLVKPATGDLLGTTITNTCPAGLEVINTWAGNDRGASSGAFANNGTVGHLILDGGDITSTFFFGGPDNVNSYALYVDLLELRNGATNRTAVNGIQEFTAFDIAPNMTIYFADAIIPGGIDISEKLNGANGGHLVWVPSFQGPFNSTNSASAQPNSINTTASSVKVSMSTVNQKLSPMIKWTALANSTNYLYYTTNLASKNWQLVTNFVQGQSTATVSISDIGRTNGGGFYKVQVCPHQ